MVEEIADIIAWENAGFATDWSHYPYETKELVKVWRNAERDVAAIQMTRTQIWYKAQFKTE